MENFTELLLIVEYSDFRDIKTGEHVLVITANHTSYGFKVWVMTKANGDICHDTLKKEVLQKMRC